MIQRIWALAVKELIQLIRDRMMAIFIVALPLAQLLLLAQATGQGIRGLSLAILDQDHSPDSRQLAQALNNVADLIWRYSPSNGGDLSGLLDAGEAAVGVVIPPGFGAALDAGLTRIGAEPPAIQVILDASNSLVAATAQTATEGAINAYVRNVAIERGLTGAAPIVLHTAVRYNPDLNARPFTIPAQMGFIIYQVTLVVASLAFARERELGTLEELLVTPLQRFELISGKAALAWLVGVVDFLLMYAMVRLVFHIPMRGSFWLLLAFSVFFVTVQIAYGIIISSFSKTQQQAILYVFMLAMLDVALSGYLVPVKNMPGLFQGLAQASPLQHYLAVVRSIMLKGADLAILWPHAAALGSIGLVAGLLALATATRTLE